MSVIMVANLNGKAAWDPEEHTQKHCDAKGGIKGAPMYGHRLGGRTLIYDK